MQSITVQTWMLHNDSVDNFICNSYNYIEHIPFFTIVRDLQYCKFYTAQKTNNENNQTSEQNNPKKSEGQESKHCMHHLNKKITTMANTKYRSPK